MQRFLLICLGGAVGTGARYLVALWTAQRFGSAFPYGTLVVNVTGCFLIALIMHLAMTNAWPATLRAALTVGFLGGFTTYSSFNYETTRLLEEGSLATALLNVLLTLAAGFTAGLIGLLLARQLAGR
jgi:CrcB protein